MSDELRAVDLAGEWARTHNAENYGRIDAFLAGFAAALAAHPADDAGWRPIETAPKDGSWFVIFTHGLFEVGRYDPSVYDRYEPVEGGLYRKVQEHGYEWEWFNNFHSATRWMPLPAPPVVG